jgi:membrane protein implicated in regulation of membrane protease activity
LKYSATNSRLPGSNPIANVFVLIVGTLAIAASIVLGFFAFLILSGIVLVMAVVIAMRVWWFKRKLQSADRGPEPQHAAATSDIIEGEFEVIADEDKGE